MDPGLPKIGLEYRLEIFLIFKSTCIICNLSKYRIAKENSIFLKRKASLMVASSGSEFSGSHINGGYHRK